jgi:hypothetical protein
MTTPGPGLHDYPFTGEPTTPLAPPEDIPVREDAPKRSRKRLWLIGGIVAAVAVAGVTTGLVATSSSPAKLRVNGTMSLLDTDGSGIRAAGDKTCSGSGGYSDIQEGAEVVISDDQGATLVITHLTGGSGSSLACVFDFTAQVPAGKHFYGVTVSHRGTVKMTEAEVSHAAVSLGN